MTDRTYNHVRGLWRPLATGVLWACVLVMLYAVSHPAAPHQTTTTVPTSEMPQLFDMDSVPEIPDTEPAPRPHVGHALWRMPLSFRGPDGVILLPWGVIWDDVPTDCKTKLLALVANRNRPFERWAQPTEYVGIRDAEHGTAWRACPKEFKR